MPNYKIRFKNIWKKVVKKCQLLDYMDQTEIDKLYNLIETSYCTGHRFYHTLEHLIECLELFLSAEHLCNHRLNVLFAILFHDAVYDPTSQDNEEQSAQLMMQHYQHLDCINANLVYAYIIDTKTHPISECNDSNIIRDIDLSIFGKHSRRFLNYDHMILYEYTPLLNMDSDNPLKEYASRRCEVLKHFYSERIFVTDYFYNKFQSRAESNLRNMIRHYESILFE